MELDEMKLAWQALDLRVTQQNAISRQLQRDWRLVNTRKGLRNLVAVGWIHIVVGALGALFFAPFWIAHRGELAPLIAGLCMHVYCLSLIVFGVVMLVQMASIDYAAPVLIIQRQLATLRRRYVIGGWLVGLPWWFLTAPILVVLSQGAIMVNAPWAVWSQLIVGATGVLAMVWFYRWSHRAGHEALALKVDNAMAGASIRRAQQAVEAIARFEQD